MKNNSKIFFSVLVLFIYINFEKSYSKEKNRCVKFIQNATSNCYLQNCGLIYFHTTKESQIQKNLFYNFDVRVYQDTIKSQKEALPAKRRFIGKVFSYGLPPAPGLGPCEVGVFKTYYFFGLIINGPNPVTKPLKKNEYILIQEVVPCGTEYIPAKEEKKVKANKLDKSDKKDKSETLEETEIEKGKRKADELIFE